MSNNNLTKNDGKNHNKIEIIDIETLKNVESPYVRPFRLKYRIYNNDDNNRRIKLWDCIRTHDSVAIMIYNVNRNCLVFVKQFRPPVYLSTLFNRFNCSIENVDELKEKSKQLNDDDCGYTLELCAGIIDKQGMTPKEIAREEIIEETGYDPPLNSIELITSFRTGVGTSGALQHLFFCQVDDSMRVSSGGGVDDESIEVVELSIEDAKKEMYANDEQSGLGRTGGFRFAICWFIYVKYPEILSKKQQ